MKISTGRLVLSILALSLSMLGCTRESNQSAKLRFSVDQSHLSNKITTQALTVDDVLVHIVINVRGDGISRVITWNWDADEDLMAATGVAPLPPSIIEVDVPAGPGRLIQYLGVYSNMNTGAMNFYYGDSLKAVLSGHNDVLIQTNSIATSSGTEHQVAGRFKTTATNGPTGLLEVLIQPPAADRPPMLIMMTDMIGGWFSSMLLEGIAFSFRLQPQGIVLFNLNPSNLTVGSPEMMHVYAPTHQRNGDAKDEQPWVLHLGYFGPGASGNEKMCYRNAADVIPNITQTDGSTAISWIPGAVTDAPAQVYRVGGTADDDITYASLCVDNSDHNSFLLEYHNLSNGLRDGIGIQGPFMTNFSVSASQGVILTDVSTNLQIDWNYLPGYLNSQSPMSGVSVFTRPRNPSDQHVRGDDLPCRRALLDAGFVHRVDLPAALESYTLTTASTATTAIALCPFTDSFGPRIYFSSFLQAGSDGGGAAPTAPQPVTKLQIDILGDFTTIGRNICYPIEILGLDSNSNIGQYTSSQIITLTDSPTSGGDVTIFSDPSCSIAMPSFTVQNNEFGHKLGFISTISSGTLNLNATNGSLTDHSRPLIITLDVSVLPAANFGSKIIGPAEVNPYECTALFVTPSDVSGYPAPQRGTADTIYFDDNGQGGMFYSGPDCIGATPSHIFNPGNSGQFVFYKNPSISSDTTTTFRVGNTAIAVEYDSTAVQFRVPGAASKTFTKIDTHTQTDNQLHTGFCYPIKVSMKDQFDKATTAGSARTVTVAVIPGEAILYTDPACSAGNANSLIYNFAIADTELATIYIMPIQTTVNLNVSTSGFTAESSTIQADQTRLRMTGAISATANFCNDLLLEVVDSGNGPIPVGEFNGRTFITQITSTQSDTFSGLSNLGDSGCNGLNNPNVLVHPTAVGNSGIIVKFETDTGPDGAHSLSYEVIGDAAQPAIINTVGQPFTW